MSTDKLLMAKVIDYNKYRRYCFNNQIKFEQNLEYERILKARYMKIGRIKKRFLYLLCRYEYLYFVTFTFDDKNLIKSDRFKKDIIKESLYNFDDDIKYILNVDYSPINDREHYHGVVATNCPCNFINYLMLAYPNIAYSERIRLDLKSFTKVSKYINKLSNHAVKSGSRNKRVLYNFKGYDKFDSIDKRVIYFMDKWKVGLT